MKELKETVCCVFGSEKQTQARLLDRKWCEEHCGQENRNKRLSRSYDCFWHFTELGLNMSKR